MNTAMTMRRELAALVDDPEALRQLAKDRPCRRR